MGAFKADIGGEGVLAVVPAAVADAQLLADRGLAAVRQHHQPGLHYAFGTAMPQPQPHAGGDGLNSPHLHRRRHGQPRLLPKPPMQHLGQGPVLHHIAQGLGALLRGPQPGAAEAAEVGH